MVAELEDAHAVLPLAPVVSDGELANPQSTAAPDTAHPELDLARLDPTPLKKVLLPDKPLARLRELQHGVLGVDLMGGVRIPPSGGLYGPENRGPDLLINTWHSSIQPEAMGSRIGSGYLLVSARAPLQATSGARRICAMARDVLGGDGILLENSTPRGPSRP